MKTLRRAFFLGAAGIVFAAPMLVSEPVELPATFNHHSKPAATMVVKQSASKGFNQQVDVPRCDQDCIKTMVRIVSAVDDYNAMSAGDDEKRHGKSGLFDTKHATSKSSYLRLRVKENEMSAWISPAPQKPMTVSLSRL